MPFKKNDQKTIQAAIKGDKNKRKGIASEEWKTNNPKRYAKIIEQRRIQGGRLFSQYRDKEHQSNAGKKSRYYENAGMEQLKARYSKVFPPSVVCDAICINQIASDWYEIVFAEIKQGDPKKGKASLRPKQEEFQKICEKLGVKYEIVYV